MLQQSSENLFSLLPLYPSHTLLPLYHTGKLKGHSYQPFSFTVVHINNIGEASLEVGSPQDCMFLESNRIGFHCATILPPLLQEFPHSLHPFPFLLHAGHSPQLRGLCPMVWAAGTLKILRELRNLVEATQAERNW